MNTFTRSLLFTAMAAVGLTQGCSCSDDDDPAPVVITPPDGPEPTVTTISGVAAKGLILGGVVNVHPIINGVLSQTPIGTGTTTDADTGAYSINIQNYDGNPFVVRVTTSETTMMRCDLAAGCGDGTAFGDDVPLHDTDFNLDAVVPPITTSDTTVNLSVLTDTATDVALDSLASLTDTSLANVGAAVNRANTSVANRFGVIGSLRTLPVVDLTSPAALVGVEQDVIRYNLLSVGIVENLVNGGAAQSISQAVGNFATQFATNGGLADTETGDDAANVTLAEILANASNVINAIRERDTSGAVTDLITNIQTTVDADKNLAEQGSTEPDPGTPSTDGEPLAKVKAMVAVLGDVGTSIDMANVGDSTIGTETEAFETQVQAAELATSAGLENAVEASALTVEAMARAYEAYDEDNTLTSWTSEDGILVAVTEVVETDSTTQETTVTEVKLMVEQSVVVNEVPVAIAMTGTVDGYEMTETMDDVSETHTAEGTVWISGSAEEATVKLDVMPTSKFMASDLMVVSTNTDAGTSDEWSTGDIALMLDVKITEKSTETGADPVSFTGKLSTSLNMLHLTEGWEYADGIETETYQTSIKTAKFSLWGVVANTTGDSMKVSLAVNGDGTGVTFTEMWSSTAGDSDSDNETATNYAKLSATLAFEAQLASIPSAVKASLNLTRSGLEAVTSTLSLKWPANLLTVKATDDGDDTTAQVVTVTNQDGVKAVFTDGDDGWTGTITLDGTEYATVDGAIVMYNDGSFGSLDILE